MGQLAALWDRARSFFSAAAPPAVAAGMGGLTFDLPLFEPPAAAPAVDRRAEATEATAGRVKRAKEAMMAIGAGFGLDTDDDQYRRLTSGAKFQRRDLTPLQQDRMLEVTWYLWEQNPFARRLVTLMTDLILGEGIEVAAKDDRLKNQIDLTWKHPSNTLGTRIREFHNFLSLAGELFLPVVPNPITGRPVLGFIDPYQVKFITPDPNNVLIPDSFTLKGDATSGGIDGKTYKIMRVNPATNRLEGDAFFFAINKLPNSLRGRSDLLPLADWLDLYDQYMFGEVQRLNLLSAFVWDLEIDTTDDNVIKEKAANFPNPRPGMLYAHNSKEKLEARTPSLNATDRSEVARLLRLHIAGTMGFPLSYLGDANSNKATAEAQNDVMMKTPAARQKEFAAMIGILVEFIIQSTTAANPILYTGADPGWSIRMPEIAAKDIARVSASLSQVAAANDIALANGTLSRYAATVIQLSLVKHLGVQDLEPQQVMDAADKDAEDRQAKFDDQQQALAATTRRSGRGNPPPPAVDGSLDAEAA